MLVRSYFYKGKHSQYDYLIVMFNIWCTDIHQKLEQLLGSYVKKDITKRELIKNLKLKLKF